MCEKMDVDMTMSFSDVTMDMDISMAEISKLLNATETLDTPAKDKDKTKNEAELEPKSNQSINSTLNPELSLDKLPIFVEENLKQTVGEDKVLNQTFPLTTSNDNSTSSINETTIIEQTWQTEETNIAVEEGDKSNNSKLSIGKLPIFVEENLKQTVGEDKVLNKTFPLTTSNDNSTSSSNETTIIEQTWQTEETNIAVEEGDKSNNSKLSLGKLPIFVKENLKQTAGEDKVLNQTFPLTTSNDNSTSSSNETTIIEQSLQTEETNIAVDERDNSKWTLLDEDKDCNRNQVLELKEVVTDAPKAELVDATKSTEAEAETSLENSSISTNCLPVSVPVEKAKLDLCNGHHHDEQKLESESIKSTRTETLPITPKVELVDATKSIEDEAKISTNCLPVSVEKTTFDLRNGHHHDEQKIESESIKSTHTVIYELAVATKSTEDEAETCLENSSISTNCLPVSVTAEKTKLDLRNGHHRDEQKVESESIKSTRIEEKIKVIPDTEPRFSQTYNVEIGNMENKNESFGVSDSPVPVRPQQELIEGKQSTQHRSSFSNQFDPLYLISGSGKEGIMDAENEEKMNLIHEMNRLKLELNQVKQENTTLTLEVQKKEELYLKAEADFQQKESQFKIEINQLHDKLESIHQDNNNDELHHMQKELKESKGELQKLQEENARYKKIMNEYESTFSAKNCETEKLKMEHNIVNKHLAALEVAFSDVITKYDRSKDIIAGYGRNEDTLKECLEKSNQIAIKYEERYETLKGHAKSQLDKANKDILAIKDKHQAEINKLATLIKRLEIKNGSLQQTLEQKTAECAALASLCDEMTGADLQ